MLKIFLCHASPDKPAVRSLRDALRAAGFLPWFDEEELLPGDRWEPKIRGALRESDAVIICLSPACVTREGFVQKEIRDALRIAEEIPDDRTFLIPAKIAPCDLPDSLAHLHSVDLSTGAGMARLLRALELLEARKRGKPNVRQEGALPALLVSDQTEFASDMTALLTIAGFSLQEWVPAFRHLSSLAPRFELDSASLVCVIRGEGFSAKGNDRLFSELTSYVMGGGVLVATSWVAWENYHSRRLSAVLPVEAPVGSFREDQEVVVRPTAEPLSQRLFREPFKLRNSFEDTVPSDGAIVLLETNLGMPIIAVKRHGQGRCIYLNTCQHTCRGTMPSPLTPGGAFRAGISRLFEVIHGEIRSARKT